jgi:hypothetical protein
MLTHTGTTPPRTNPQQDTPLRPPMVAVPIMMMAASGRGPLSAAQQRQPDARGSYRRRPKKRPARLPTPSPEPSCGKRSLRASPDAATPSPNGQLPERAVGKKRPAHKYWRTYKKRRQGNGGSGGGGGGGSSGRSASSSPDSESDVEQGPPLYLYKLRPALLPAPGGTMAGQQGAQNAAAGTEATYTRVEKELPPPNDFDHLPMWLEGGERASRYDTVSIAEVLNCGAASCIYM